MIIACYLLLLLILVVDDVLCTGSTQISVEKNPVPGNFDFYVQRQP